MVCEQHIVHLPTSVRPNSLCFRVSRFYQLNRIAVSAVALVILALIAGLGIALWQNSKARRENAKAEAVNAFLQEMLSTSNRQYGDGRKGYQTTVNDILAEAEKRLESREVSNQPEV